MKDIIKFGKSLEESVLLIKGICDKIRNWEKEQKDGYLPILLGTLAASILRDALSGSGVIKAGEWTIRAGQIF